MTKLIPYVAFALFLASCITPKALKIEYYKSQSRVGLLIVTDSVKVFRNFGESVGTAGGVISRIVVSKFDPDSRYSKIVANLKSPFSVDSIRQLYVNCFAANGKKLDVLDVVYSGKTANALLDYPPAEKFKGYFDKDVRWFKVKYNIDELLIVYVRCGIGTYFHFGAEVNNPTAFMQIEPRLVSLNDNSLIFRGKTFFNSTVKDWDHPPQYENMQKAITEAYRKALLQEKLSYKL